MTRLLPQASLLASLFLLTACSGPAEPSFPRKLDSSNSIKAVVKVEGGGPANVKLNAGYFASSESCKYIPRAFGVVAQTGPVTATAYMPLVVKKLNSSEFVAQVPLPLPDKCQWKARKVVPEITVDGIAVSVFTPDMSVTGGTYLPQGRLVYYCKKSQMPARYGGDKYVSCRLAPSGDETMEITINFTI